MAPSGSRACRPGPSIEPRRRSRCVRAARRGPRGSRVQTRGRRPSPPIATKWPDAPAPLGPGCRPSGSAARDATPPHCEAPQPQRDPRPVGGPQVRRQPARRPRSRGRAPGAHPRASRYCDGPSRNRVFASAMRTVERPTRVALVRSATVASDWEERASSNACSEIGSAASAGAILAVIGRSSGRSTSLERGRGGDIALWHRPSSFGRGHRHRAKRRCVAVQPEIVAQPQADGERPAHPPGGRGHSVGRSTEPKSRWLSPGWKPHTQEWGQFRTVNWTPNAENRPRRERRAAGRRAQKLAISRQKGEMARPGIEPGTPRFSVV